MSTTTTVSLKGRFGRQNKYTVVLIRRRDGTYTATIYPNTSVAMRKLLEKLDEENIGYEVRVTRRSDVVIIKGLDTSKLNTLLILLHVN